VLTLAIYGLINASFFSVKEITIPVENLDKEVTIVQLSDIHVGTIHKAEFLRRIVDKVNEMDPDMVLITGDLFDGSGKIMEDTVAPLNDLKAKTFFSTGNHEMYEGLDNVMAILATTNIQVLRNEFVEHSGIQVIGVDNPEQEAQRRNVALKDIKFDNSKPSVLMFHQPNGVDDAVSAGVDLQLSGHTHNGQIVPFNLISRLFYPRVHGLYTISGMSLYVSPGTGTWGPPMRVGSSNEITLIRLVKI
jgi:predicted MPP superfamily phosphohydrolase